MADAPEPDDYVLASGVGHTVGELATIAFPSVGLDSRDYVAVDDALRRPPEATPSVGDPDRARRKLGWRPEISFEQLVEGMVRHDVRELQEAVGRPGRDVDWPHWMPSVGVIGLGYVGPAARRRVRRRGLRRGRGRHRRAPDRGAQGGRSYIEDVPPRRSRAVAGPFHGDHRLRALADGRRSPDLRPDAADREPRTGSRAADRLRSRSRACCAPGSWSCSSPLPSRARRGRSSRRCWKQRACRGQGFHARLFARARRPGPHRLHAAQHPEAHRRHDRGLRRARAALYAHVCDDLVRSRAPRPPSSRSCSRTSSARSTSRSSTSSRCSTDRMGIDVWEVIDAAATKPYGFMRFSPGPGMGGHCLPVDPFYLSWRAREFDMSTEFIELAGKINQQMPYHCVGKAERMLNDAEQAGPRLADRDHRRRLQAERRRPARVAGAEDHRVAAGTRRGGRLPRPARAGAPGVRTREHRLDGALPGAGLAIIVTAHDGSTTTTSRCSATRYSTCAA